MSNLMTVAEVAEFLDMNQETIYQMARKRKLPALKIGGAWYFSKNTINEWIAEQSETGKGSILIVDDEAMIRDLIEDVVSRQGYKVTIAETGEKAQEKLLDQQFDLIFLDVVLPDTNGTEILRTMKSLGKNTPVAIITGHADSPVAMEALSLGPIFFIRKPFQIDDILRILDSTAKFSMMSQGVSCGV